MLSAQLSGTLPVGYHLIDILLHGMSCCLLFSCLLMFGFHKKVSFWSTMIFCVHPAQTQAVAWIAGRNDSLLAVFILLCVLSLLQYLSTYHLRW